MATYEGISSIDPSAQSTSVTSAITGSVPYEAVQSGDSVINQLQSINTLLHDTQPSIKDDVKSIAASVAKITDVLASQSLNMTLSLGDGSDLTIKTLLSFAKSKTADLLFKSGDAVYHFMSRVAASEKYVKSVDTVIQSINNFSVTLSKMGTGLLKITGSLALLGLTIFAISNYFKADPTSLLSFAAAMIVVGGAMWAFNKFVNEKELIKTVAGIALLGATVFMISNAFDANVESIAMFVGSMAAIGGAVFLLNKFVNPGQTIATSIALGVFALAAYGISAALSNFEGISWETLAIAGAAIVGSGLAMAGAGMLVQPIILGSVAMAAAAGGMYLLSKALKSVSEVDIDLEQLGRVGIATGAIVGALILIGNPLTLPFVLSGAAQMIAVSGATVLIAKSLDVVSSISIPSDTDMNNFKYGATTLRDTFIAIGNPLYLPFMLSGLATSALIAGGTIALSGAMAIVSKVPLLEPEQYDNFKYGAISLADIYADIGGPIKLAKIVAGAAVITLVSGATIAIATGIRLFSAIISDPSTVDKSVTALDSFITGTVTSFTKFDASAFATVATGIRSFQGISNLVAEIAASVVGIGNLTFEEKEMRDGKLVTVNTRAFKPEDFDRVGTSIGMIIKALTAPLVAVGEQTSGMLFKSNKVQKGIEALSGISSIFVPLTNIVDVFSRNKITASDAESFSLSMQTMISGITSALSSIDEDLDEDTIELMSDGIESLNGLIDNITDDKFAAGVEQFGKMREHLASIKDSVNTMDLGKLTALNDFMINVQHAEDNEALEKLAEAMQLLAESLSPVQQSSTASSTSNSAISNTIVNKKAAAQQQSDMIEILSEGNESVQKVLQQIYMSLISGQLKVKTQPIATL